MKHVIAIVDDEDSLRDAIATFLELEGHEVRAFDDAARALEALLESPPDLLLTDIRMQGLSGIELIRALKGEHPRLQALIMTGYGSYTTAVEALRLGVVDYLEKPVRLDVLKACLERALCAGGEIRGEDPDRLALRSGPDAMERCARFLAGRLGELALPGEERRKLTLAALAAVENALTHAYGGGEAGPIELRVVQPHRGAASIEVVDRGRGFDPFSSEGILRDSPRESGLQLALRLVPNLQIESSPDQGARIVIPIDMEILSTCEAWAAWSVAPGGPDPWGEERSDLPWVTPELERSSASSASGAVEGELLCEERERTARSVLWL